jgi:hypothetical protein
MLVVSALGLDRIACISRTAISPAAFVAALRIGLPEAMKQFPTDYPILHISAHGAKQGIQLSNGAIMNWSDLRELLVPINESLGGALLLCMSACEGFAACQMAMEQDDAKQPYFAMVGSYKEPTWSDTAVSYLTFYHLVAKGQAIDDAVAAMRTASGHDSWTIETAENTRRAYLEFLRRSSELGTAQRELETVADQAELPPDAKALETRRGGSPAPEPGDKS